MYKLLFSRLINTRTSLMDACNSLDIDINSIDYAKLESLTMSCANCYIWLPKRQFVMEDEMPICSFCADMSLLRF